MNPNVRMFGVAVLILTLILAVILGLMAAPTNPITWILIALLIAVPFITKKLETTHYVIWKDEYSVGIDSIDQQHKKLIGMINQLQIAVDHKTNAGFEHEAIDALVDYTKTHFTYEEGLLVQNDYPDYEPHKAQHEAMIKEIEAVIAEYNEDPDTAMLHASNYLKDWLINHINGTDKKYSSYLIDRGVK